MYVCIYVSNATGMQLYCKHISCGHSIACTCSASERSACTAMDSPVERGWQLGRLLAQLHRSSGSEEKGTSVGSLSTACRADSAAG